MASIDFEGRRVPVEDGDTVGSALFRAGVRTFTRSLKYHRRRGLYCVTGDCPNCLCNVDGEPGARACTTPAVDGMRVVRESGWPSTERDLLNIADKAGHRFMPVGFYYKTFTRPKAAWELAEKLIRRATGIGRLPMNRAPQPKPTRHVHPDVLVVGSGVSGLSAASEAARNGRSVLLVDEGTVADTVSSPRTRERIDALLAALPDSVTLCERHTAIGIYDGPFAAVVGPDEMLQVWPDRIIVATGAVETHAVFLGNDLPGVWLGRGAARMAGIYRVPPGRSAVVAIGDDDGLDSLEVLRANGVEIAAVLAPAGIAERVPAGLPVIEGGELVAAEGRKAVTAAKVMARSETHTFDCDAIVVSLGLSPRDGLLRMGNGLPVVAVGDALSPGCSIDEAADQGTRAGAGDPVEAPLTDPPQMGKAGYVCLCEDVGVKDLERAWGEGWRSSEILKRYTTATMGPCQGALCGRHLAAFAAAHTTDAEGPPASVTGARTTARPPARTVRLEDLAGAVHEVIEKRTALHDHHLSIGGRVDWSGSWKRPYHYGDWTADYRAVRERVSLMDVSTLGKMLVTGVDAQRLLDHAYPCRIDDLAVGRSRYMISLDEAGYVMDDGMVLALPDGAYYVSSTSGGADRHEAMLRNWADRLDLHVHILNQTAMLGAINLAGPHARDVLEQLTDDPVDAEALPHMHHADITVAGVPCRAIRVGFVGELSYELHHPRSHSVALWTAFSDAGRTYDLRPHGLDALDLLRMEKGHFYLLQDTLPDDHPAKLGLDWAVAMDKPNFVGKVALERMAAIPLERKLVGLEIEGTQPQRGVPLYADGTIVGRVTSCAFSPSLDRSIGMGWLRSIDGAFPTALRAGDDRAATVVPRPFYDPEGARLRA
jgi:sarcosine oxidase subunit alpha